MENTVESLLSHGDKDPQSLLEQLKNGSSSTSTSLDEELARQLSTGAGERLSATREASAPATATTGTALGRGTPTTLPDDFLRCQTSTDQATLESDAALARMLQDQLFSEELSRNPDFAHLAGRRPSNHGTQQQQQAANRSAFTARGHQTMPLPNLMEKLSGEYCSKEANHDVGDDSSLISLVCLIFCPAEMGTSAKFKLAQMAEQFKANTNRLATGGADAGDRGNGHEMRGLLDREDNDTYELASRKDL
jgi:hypothetical protein